MWQTSQPEVLTETIDNSNKKHPDYRSEWIKKHPNYMKEWKSRNREKQRHYRETWNQKHPNYMSEWRKEHPNYGREWKEKHSNYKDYLKERKSNAKRINAVATQTTEDVGLPVISKSDKSIYHEIDELMRKKFVSKGDELQSDLTSAKEASQKQKTFPFPVLGPKEWGQSRCGKTRDRIIF